MNLLILNALYYDLLHHTVLTEQVTTKLEVNSSCTFNNVQSSVRFHAASALYHNSGPTAFEQLTKMQIEFDKQ